MKYMLDTNIVSDLARHPRGVVRNKIAERQDSAICTSILVAAELRFGLARKASAKLKEQVEAVLGRLEVLPLETPSDAHYGLLRAQLEKAGTPIGANDMLIAAHALALGCTLVTDNVREFKRVKGLKVENWLR